MGRVVGAVLVSIVVLAGCSQASTPPTQGEKEDVEQAVEERPEPPADVPAYDLTKDEQGTVGAGLTIRALSASTDATSEEDLEAITRDLWARGTETDSMQVVFYPNEPGADTTGTGMAFASEEAARVTFEEMGADPEVVEPDVQKAMRNDGIHIIPTKEMIDEVIAEECANWDTTTLGTPPPEWNCEDL